MVELPDGHQEGKTAGPPSSSSHKGPSDSRLGYLRSSSTRYCGAVSSVAPCSGGRCVPQGNTSVTCRRMR
jgi:hypothetical protein